MYKSISREFLVRTEPETVCRTHLHNITNEYDLGIYRNHKNTDWDKYNEPKIVQFSTNIYFL